jgi:ribonuclease P protein component
MLRATFPAAARMHRPTEFAAALSGKRLARGAYFIVTANPASPSPGLITCSGDEGMQNSIENLPPQAPIARLGLIMAKRLAHHASTRNALKRVVREAFRAQRLQLPAADYVVRLHKRIQDISLTQLKLAARVEADAHFSKVR